MENKENHKIKVTSLQEGKIHTLICKLLTENHTEFIKRPFITNWKFLQSQSELVVEFFKVLKFDLNRSKRFKDAEFMRIFVSSFDKVE